MNREEFRRRLVEDLGEDFAYSYFDPSGFTEGAQPVVRPWSHIAAERLHERAYRTFEREGVKLGPTVAEHMKPKHERGRA